MGGATIIVTAHELERYSQQADEAERIVFQSGDTVTGSNVHLEMVTGLTRTIRALIEHIREEKQRQKD